MKTQQSTLFINRLTTVDCAILARFGEGTTAFLEAIGFSFNVDVEVVGNIDPVEKVIVDFGKLKKDLKSEIDSIEYGYDHKLIAPRGVFDSIYKLDETADRIRILKKDIPILDVPVNAIKFIETSELENCLSKDTQFIESMIFRNYDRPSATKSIGIANILKALALEIKQFLQQRVDVLYEGKDIVVESVHCDLETTRPRAFLDDPRGLSSTSMFTYTHGLKNSTSMGCRNIVHGHLSYVQLVGSSVEDDDYGSDYVKYVALVDKMTSALNSTHFVWDENLKTLEYNSVADSYVAPVRGHFFASLSEGQSKGLFSNVVCMSNESTIENLVEYVYKMYEKELVELGVKTIYVSEGLHKGSFKHVEYQ